MNHLGDIYLKVTMPLDLGEKRDSSFVKISVWSCTSI